MTFSSKWSVAWVRGFALLLALFWPAVQAQQIDNCGISVPIEAPAQRVVALNQHAAEAILALGADEQLIGTAYQDDRPPSRWLARFNAIPRLADEYPNPETLLGLRPDLLVAGFSSAFSDWGIGPRTRWQKYGVPSYLFESSCPQAEVSLEGVFADVMHLGQLLGRQSQARRWQQAQQQRLRQLDWPANQRKPRVLLWLREYELPYVAGCCGAGNLLIERAGGINVAKELPKHWGHLSWEAVLAKQPDLILMVDSNWSSFAQKQQHLHSSPFGRQLQAVKSNQLVPIGFSETVAGVRLIDGMALAHKRFLEVKL